MTTAVIKTILAPLIFTPIAYLFGLRGPYLVSVFVLFAAPSAVSCYIMAKGMGADEELTAGIIILTTAISSVTLFIGIFILRNLGLI
jgi:predicted permease